MPASTKPLPHWNLSNIYPSLESTELEADLEMLAKALEELEFFLHENGIERLEAPPVDTGAAANTLKELLERLNQAGLHVETIGAYVYGFVTTDSYNQPAARRMSQLEQLEVRYGKCMTRFTAWIGSLAPVMDSVCPPDSLASRHRGYLNLLAEHSRYLMETRMEELAAELQMSGGGVMWKLQGNVTSQLKMPFERDGKSEMLPMTAIRNLANDPDESVRRRAYETELEGWASIRQPVAFALNCVKGASITLARRRDRKDVLDASLDRSRIDRETLEALLDAIRDAFPVFRRYLFSKAGKLGKDKLPWWDLFAPVGSTNPTYDWDQARSFIVEQFARFSPELSEFASRAFDESWIDAEPRDGKRGGAFCMRIPRIEESRILANFDGSFDQVITLAHELGHAYHNYCQKGLPHLLLGAPMTLAETASIFCETIAFNAALESAPPDARLAVLENQLMGATQVTVDISSRFIFESEVLKRRADAELGPDDFCAIMLDAQKETYGESLDFDHLHPYMWLLKPHYYMSELDFYNFPYAFGQLFGLGIYAVYRREGEAFIPRYKELLRSTASGRVADLVARFGIDVRSKQFWKGSLDVLAEQVDEYCRLNV